MGADTQKALLKLADFSAETVEAEARSVGDAKIDVEPEPGALKVQETRV